MANGLSDILSAYRQGVASERQTRQAEMSMALQAMQFEAQQRFREEGRQREDVLSALDYAKKSTTEAIGQDASQIYTKISSLSPIVGADIDKETGALEGTDKIINALSKPINKKGQYGFTPAQATEIVNIANTYSMAAKNPLLAQSAQDLAVSFGRKVARDYDIYERTGFTQSSKFIKSLERSGLLYRGPDPLQRDISSDVFLGVNDALTALDNIDKERMEIAKGDYKVDTPITVSGVAQDTDVSGIDFNALANLAGVSLGLTGEEPGPALNVDLGAMDDTTDEDILATLDFLEEGDVSKIETKLSALSSEISKKKESLSSKIDVRDALISQVDDAKEKNQELIKKIKYFNKLGDEAKVRQLMKESRKLQREIRSGKASEELEAYNMSKVNPNALTIGGYHPDSISAQIASLSQEIGQLNKQRVKLGG